jgi:tetratricopeptide (TPR) repeat protein
MPEILQLIAQARGAAFEHRFDQAARLASAVLERLPNCLAALRILAWAQLELDADDEPTALTTFQRCVALDPEDPFAYVGQAIWYQQRQDNQSAIRLWTHAWELDPQNQAIRRALVKLTGDLPESVLAEAIVLVRASREDDAADLLRQLRRERTDSAVALKLISALWASGAQREAFDVALAVHASDPQSVKAALYVAALEDRAGRTLRSREAIARAEQVDPGLALFADVVRQIGLENALDQHRASRTPLAAAR